MSSYAVLGATGNVGGKIVRLLLDQPDNKLNLYVRDKTKLLKGEPRLEASDKVSIYEGDLDDVELIKNCISNTKAIFLAVALSENLPGCTISIDTTRIVIDALLRLRSENPKSPVPKLVVLSSSSVADHFWKDVPKFVHNAIYNANYHIYEDLRKAEALLRKQSEWLRVVFVKPGGLSEDTAHGYKLDLTWSHTFMSYMDLAAAMIEMADSADEKWNMKEVGLVPATTAARFEIRAPYVLGKGLVATFFPNLYLRIRTWLP